MPEVMSRQTRPSASPSSLAPTPSLAVCAIMFLVFLALSAIFTWPLVTNPGELLGGTNDPPLFTWILSTVASALYEDPSSLFEGGIFYPYGRSISFSEPLILPALLVAAPVEALSGNPILAYNVTLLVFMSLSAWAAWYAGFRFSGSHAGAFVTAIVFAYSSYKIGYYNFLNIHLSFALPLSFVFFATFLETNRFIPLLVSIVLLALQASTIWYGALPLGIVLALFTVFYFLLRPGFWPISNALKLAAAAVVLALLVAPVAAPYFSTHSEMDFVRSLAEVDKFRADLLSLLDSGLHSRWQRMVDSGREPGLFVGFMCLGLALIGIVGALIRSSRAEHLIGRAALTALSIAVLTTIVTIFYRSLCFVRDQDASVECGPLSFLSGALLIIFMVLVVAVGVGSRRARRGRALDRHEWALVSFGFVLFGIALVLGPEIHVADQPAGPGLYSYLFEWVPGFKGLRISIRLAFVYLFFIGLLAALGVAAIGTRLSQRGRHWLWLAPIISCLELMPAPLNYDVFAFDAPPSVYQALASDPDSGVVLELPTFDEHRDSLYMLWSLSHGRKLVNGVSGFYPPHIQPLATLARTLPNRRNIEPLLNIHELRFLVVHLDALNDVEVQNAWIKLAVDTPPGLVFIDQYDEALLFKVSRNRQNGWRWRRLVPARALRAANEMQFDIELSADARDRNVEHVVDVRVNDVAYESVVVDVGHNHLVLPRPTVDTKVHPVAITLNQHYRLKGNTATDSAYAIGDTGVYSPVDIVVESGSRGHGALASVWVNGLNLSNRSPGYNVVVLDPHTGKRISQATFDLAKDAAHNGQLSRYIDKIADGSLVIVAEKSRGIDSIDAVGRAALASIGANALESRNVSATESHVIIGVKGAAPGTAIERVEDQRLRVVVGVDRSDQPMAVTDFRLLPQTMK